jgi:hypothetical protein
MASLNTIISRVRTISLAHKQVRKFYYGAEPDFLTDKTTQYAAVFLQIPPNAVIDVSGSMTSITFRMFCMDLVHVASDTKSNELDVQSDMLQVLSDLIAEINHSEHPDWKISNQNNVQFLYENGEDMAAGVVADITISFPYTKDTCAVPTDTYDLSDLT